MGCRKFKKCDDPEKGVEICPPKRCFCFEASDESSEAKSSQCASYGQEDIEVLILVAGSIDARFDIYRKLAQPLDSGLHDWLKEALLPFRT